MSKNMLTIKQQANQIETLEGQLDRIEHKLAFEWTVFSVIMRNTRIRRQLTLRGLAKTLGLSAAYLCQIESAIRKPSAQTREAIVKALS